MRPQACQLHQLAISWGEFENHVFHFLAWGQLAPFQLVPVDVFQEAIGYHNGMGVGIDVFPEAGQVVAPGVVQARIRVENMDILPPLVDALTRFAEGRVMNVSGTAQDEPFNKWRSQAWRMEIISLEKPLKAPPVGQVTQTDPAAAD